MRNLTEILLIADVSGSRESMREEARTGLNKFIRDQQAIPGDANLSLVFFNSGPEFMRKAMWRQPLQTARQILDSEFVCTGGTQLNDCVGISIDELGKDLDKLPEDQKPNKVLVAIETDGLENSSHLFTTAEIKAKIEHQKNVYNWAVLYLAQHLGAESAGRQIGVTGQSVRAFATSGQGTYEKYAAMNNAAVAYRATGDMSVTADALAADPSIKWTVEEAQNKQREKAHK